MQSGIGKQISYQRGGREACARCRSSTSFLFVIYLTPRKARVGQLAARSPAPPITRASTRGGDAICGTIMHCSPTRSQYFREPPGLVRPAGISSC